jgi:hypothetical protein
LLENDKMRVFKLRLAILVTFQGINSINSINSKLSSPSSLLLADEYLGPEPSALDTMTEDSRRFPAAAPLSTDGFCKTQTGSGTAMNPHALPTRLWLSFTPVTGSIDPLPVT